MNGFMRLQGTGQPCISAIACPHVNSVTGLRYFMRERWYSREVMRSCWQTWKGCITGSGGHRLGIIAEETPFSEAVRRRENYQWKYDCRGS